MNNLENTEIKILDPDDPRNDIDRALGWSIPQERWDNLKLNKKIINDEKEEK